MFCIWYEMLPVDAKKSTSDVNQSDNRRLQHGHRDSLKSYTPQIRYTKLEFKVISFLCCFLMLAVGTFLSTAFYENGLYGSTAFYILKSSTTVHLCYKVQFPFSPHSYPLHPLPKLLGHSSIYIIWEVYMWSKTHGSMLLSGWYILRCWISTWSFSLPT